MAPRVTVKLIIGIIRLINTPYIVIRIIADWVVQCPISHGYDIINTHN
jgi:hypothetical protein